MRAADNLGSSQGIHGGILENCFYGSWYAYVKVLTWKLRASGQV